MVLERSAGAVKAQCERRSVSEACIRDRAALHGHESTYSTLSGINRSGRYYRWLLGTSRDRLSAVLDSKCTRYLSPKTGAFSGPTFTGFCSAYFAAERPSSRWVGHHGPGREGLSQALPRRPGHGALQCLDRKSEGDPRNHSG